MLKFFYGKSLGLIGLALAFALTGCSPFGTSVSSEQSSLNAITCEVPENCMIRLTWAHSAASEVGFQIERARGSATAVFEPLASADVGVLQFADTAVTIGSSYCYRVRAFNSNGVSEFSNVACGTVTGTGPVALTFSR